MFIDSFFSDPGKGKNGGYIIESSHILQSDAKQEKIIAIYNTALKYY